MAETVLMGILRSAFLCQTIVLGIVRFVLCRHIMSALSVIRTPIVPVIVQHRSLHHHVVIPAGTRNVMGRYLEN
jgi:hypothetical protein